MTRAPRMLIAAAALALVGGAQETPSKQALPKSILLARSWEEAIKEAGIRNVPILFTTAMATWGECIGALGSVHKSRPAIEASLKVVNIIGILDLKHGSSAVDVNGRKEKRCSIVPGMTCQEHFKAADYAFLNGFPSSTGQIFVCVFNSQGKRPGKAHGNPGGEGYVKIVEEAVRKIDGPMISKPDYDAFMDKFEVAEYARSKKELRKAIDRYLDLAKHEIKRLAELAEQPLREINDEGMAHVTEAERIAWENPARAKESLKLVVSKYAPLDCSKKAEELLKKISEKAR